MPQPIYATPADLASHLGLSDPPPRADRWLSMASRDVDLALWCAVYDVDADDQPTDADVAEALRDATLWQAEYLSAVNDPVGAKGRYEAVSVGQVTYKLRSGAAGETVTMTERAVSSLRAARLLTNRVTVV